MSAEADEGRWCLLNFSWEHEVEFGLAGIYDTILSCLVLNWFFLTLLQDYVPIA